MDATQPAALRGYAYRHPRATAEQLRAVAAGALAWPCWAFGGAALWDGERAAGRDNLRPPVRAAAPAELALGGDFGHCFAATAELRWRRREDGAYDALLLAEAPLDPAAAAELGLALIGEFAARPVPAASAELLDVRGARLLLDRVEYADDRSGAVRLVRYTGLRPGEGG